MSGAYKDESWRDLGEELRRLLSDEEYASAKRTTFSAFYTSPVVISAMHEALARLGVPSNGLVLEPGCGTGNFLALAPKGMRFIGVERDDLSGRIARLFHPDQDIRIEDFRDIRLPPFDAVLGNVPSPISNSNTTGSVSVCTISSSPRASMRWNQEACWRW